MSNSKWSRPMLSGSAEGQTGGREESDNGKNRDFQGSKLPAGPQHISGYLARALSEIPQPSPGVYVLALRRLRILAECAATRLWIMEYDAATPRYWTRRGAR